MSKVDCPACSRSVTEKPFKSWKFGPYQVKRFECPNCKSKFNLYESPAKSFTIPKQAP